jgi:hypothetical protein
MGLLIKNLIKLNVRASLIGKKKSITLYNMKVNPDFERPGFKILFVAVICNFIFNSIKFSFQSHDCDSQKKIPVLYRFQNLIILFLEA